MTQIKAGRYAWIFTKNQARMLINVMLIKKTCMLFFLQKRMPSIAYVYTISLFIHNHTVLVVDFIILIAYLDIV